MSGLSSISPLPTEYAIGQRGKICYRSKREKLQSKVKSKLTTQLTHTHGGCSIEDGKNHVVRQSMYVLGHSLSSDHANGS